MPVLKATEHEGVQDVMLDWCPFRAFGLLTLKAGFTCDLHFHDCDEWWFIVRGKAHALTEGSMYEVGPGDLVYTKMGDEHQIHVLDDEDLVMIWAEGELKGQKRQGHLHKSEG